MLQTFGARLAEDKRWPPGATEGASKTRSGECWPTAARTEDSGSREETVRQREKAVRARHGGSTHQQVVPQTHRQLCEKANWGHGRSQARYIHVSIKVWSLKTECSDWMYTLRLRPFFSYWITCVHLLITGLAVAIYGIAPVGFSQHETVDSVSTFYTNLHKIINFDSWN